MYVTGMSAVASVRLLRACFFKQKTAYEMRISDWSSDVCSSDLLTYEPLAAHVRRVLDERASHQAPKSRFLDELEDHMTPDAAEQTLRAVISWGRYAEVFAYDDHTATFSLENP